MKLDKKLDRILYNMDLPATGKLINVQEWQKNQIKTVILEALKAEMPKRKKSVENMGNEMGGSFIGDDYNELYRAEDFGYNQAIDDCKKVCNKLLGDGK